jgi:hypothetical protein
VPEFDRPDPLRWLVSEWQWPKAAAFASVFLLALVPIVWSEVGFAGALIYAQLPAYMLHQLEEHGHDRFRTYVNRELAGGREALTPGVTFAINMLAVWVLMLVSFALAYYVEPGLGLIAVCTTGVNAIVHLLVGAARRGYNPGLITAAALFVPLTIVSLAEVATAYDPPGWTWAVGIGVALAGHLAIVALIGTRLSRMRD